MMSWTAIVRFLTMISLVLAPVIMLGGTAGAASPMALATGHHDEQMSAAHCAEMTADSEDDSTGFPQGDCLTDCAMTCAAVAPLASADLDAPALPYMARFAPLVSAMHGVSAESADPPPRVS